MVVLVGVVVLVVLVVLVVFGLTETGSNGCLTNLQTVS